MLSASKLETASDTNLEQDFCDALNRLNVSKSIDDINEKGENENGEEEFNCENENGDDENENGDEEFSSVLGDLYLMNESGSLELKSENVKMVLIRVNNFNYEIRLWKGELFMKEGGFIFNQPVGNSMQLTFEKKSDSIEWISYHNDQVMAWRFKFIDPKMGKTFRAGLSVAFYESSRREKFSDIVKKDEAQWIEEGYFEDYEESEDEDGEEGNDDANENDFDYNSYEQRKSPTKEIFENKNVNKNLNISMCLNRAFVFNGSSIGIFKHDEEDNLELINRVKHIYTRDGTEFAPTHSMLHESDNKMLMLNPKENDRVYVMDLNRGDVVEEWQAGASSNFNIRNFAPYHKYSQLTDEKVFACVSKNGSFLLDPRVTENNKMTHNYFYQSSNTPQFSCLATTGQGQVVIGSHKGEIRMYSEIGQKRAKTQLPGLGDGIAYLDVTQDGNWILATTRNYLLLMFTKIEGDKKQRNGFQVGMGKKKRKPIKLQLSHADMIRYNINEVNFKSASFNNGDGISEEWIVSSTGPYLVTWNFRKVKRGFRDCYKIKKTGEIIEAKFRYAKNDQVVVNMPYDVYTEKTSVGPRIAKHIV